MAEGKTTATVSVNGGPEVDLDLDALEHVADELSGMPERHVKQVDKVTGIVREVYKPKEDLPHIGEQMDVGGLVFTCSQITETEKDGDDIFTVTWKL